LKGYKKGGKKRKKRSKSASPRWIPHPFRLRGVHQRKGRRGKKKEGGEEKEATYQLRRFTIFDEEKNSFDDAVGARKGKVKNREKKGGWKPWSALSPHGGRPRAPKRKGERGGPSRNLICSAPTVNLFDFFENGKGKGGKKEGGQEGCWGIKLSNISSLERVKINKKDKRKKKRGEEEYSPYTSPY